MTITKEDPRVVAARKRVDDLVGFYWHLAFFVLANAFMVWQDLAGGGGLDWAYWAFVPWGIGLLSHAMAVFVLTPAWQERKVQELLEKDRSVH